MSATKYTPIWTLSLVVNYTSIAMIAMSKTYKCFYVLAPNLPDDLDPCGAVNEDTVRPPSSWRMDTVKFYGLFPNHAPRMADLRCLV